MAVADTVTGGTWTIDVVPVNRHTVYSGMNDDER